LTALWVGGSWPWLAALAFALTPVTVWQATAAGAPDIWMCAFIALGLLAFLQGRDDGKIGAMVLSEFLPEQPPAQNIPASRWPPHCLRRLLLPFRNCGWQECFLSAR